MQGRFTLKMAEKDKPEKAGAKRTRTGVRPPKPPKAPKVKQGGNGAPAERPAEKRIERKPAAPVEQPSKARSKMERLRTYLKAVRAEVAPITWPTKQELRAATIVVIATLVVVTLYLYAVDQIMARVFQQIPR